MSLGINCPTCGVQTKRARHRGTYCEPCWNAWLEISTLGAPNANI